MACAEYSLNPYFRRQDDSAMVFVSSELGEHSITTRDIDVNENTVVQFEVAESGRPGRLS